MKSLITSLVLMCIGIYLAYNHPDIADVMYAYFIQAINFILSFFGKVL